MVRIYFIIHYTFCYCSQNHQLICLNFPISKSSEIKLHKYKKLLISKRRIGILKKLPKQGEDSESL